jgi:hypothetical protein
MDPSVLPLLSYLSIFPTSCPFCSPVVFFSFLSLGHRSPPPHVRDTQSSSYVPQVPQASVAPTPADFVPRQSSRFDRPANSSQHSSRPRNHDVYIPTDALPQKGDREPELTSTQISAEHGTKRKRPADDPVPSRGVAPLAEAPVPTVPPERPASGSSSSQTEQSRTYLPALDYSVLHTPILVYVIFRSPRRPEESTTATPKRTFPRNVTQGSDSTNSSTPSRSKRWHCWWSTKAC